MLIQVIPLLLGEKKDINPIKDKATMENQVD